MQEIPKRCLIPQGNRLGRGVFVGRRFRDVGLICRGLHHRCCRLLRRNRIFFLRLLQSRRLAEKENTCAQNQEGHNGFQYQQSRRGTGMLRAHIMLLSEKPGNLPVVFPYHTFALLLYRHLPGEYNACLLKIF